MVCWGELSLSGSNCNGAVETSTASENWKLAFQEQPHPKRNRSTLLTGLRRLQSHVCLKAAISPSLFMLF